MILIPENFIENIISKMVAILSQPQCVDDCRVWGIR